MLAATEAAMQRLVAVFGAARPHDALLFLESHAVAKLAVEDASIAYGSVKCMRPLVAAPKSAGPETLSSIPNSQ